MNLKSNKKKKIKIFLIFLSFIFSSILFINLFPKNQLLIDQNLFSKENVDDLNVAAFIGSDWETSRGVGQIATINKPSNTQEGDLLILHCTVDGQADPMTGPFGWNVLLPENNTIDPTTASWYKIAGDSEPINYTVTWGTNERYIAGVIRITEYDKTNPIQATATATGTGDVVNPSINITNNYTLIIGFHGLDREGPGDNYNSTFLETEPTVLYAKAAGGNNQGCSSGMYYEIQTNQGISPSRTWSIGGNEDWYAATVAINLNLPIIDITSPLENEVYGVNAPNFIAEITDSNLDTMWYTVDKGMNNYTFTDNGTILQSAWDSLPDGIVTLRFYANNTLGSINFEEVNITKDSSAPIINIISPVMDEAFRVDAPSFVVEIKDSNLNTTWYTVDGGINNYTFTNNGTILQATWDSLFDGIVTLRFYANNSLGNINFEEVNITKDSSAPIISIISPDSDDAFGVDAPSFVVEITDSNLDTMWYTVDGGISNYTFIDNGTIFQTAWDSLPNGIVTLKFYANDTLGNINYQQLNITKDGSAPIISIINPISDDGFGVNAPSFIVEITDSNLNTTWYTLDGGINNYTFTNNGTILQAAWDSLPDGIVTLKFYANDTLGNINFQQLNITKDGSTPFISISNPVLNEVFGVTAPNFIVEIMDSNLDTMWYSISNITYKSQNITFIVNGTINPVEWGLLFDGTYTIIFYANDTLANIHFEEVNVTKDGSAPLIGIINPILNEMFGVTPPDFIVEITDPNMDTMWYSIFNGIFVSQNITFTVNGTISPVEWGVLYDGVYTIRFYANDTLGNVNYKYYKSVNE
ncbi:MAG: hypothetical protein ACXABG_04155 [Promethearchaeota archaeon]